MCLCARLFERASHEKVSTCANRGQKRVSGTLELDFQVVSLLKWVLGTVPRLSARKASAKC